MISYYIGYFTSEEDLNLNRALYEQTEEHPNQLLVTYNLLNLIQSRNL